MIERLKARKAEIACLREERGATDPILIIAGIAITLILLVGGSFAISGFIANANDLNAKGDLDRVATAQAAYLASNDRYGQLSVGPDVASQNTELSNSSIGFTPTAGNNMKVRTSAAGWTAVTGSASGGVFLRTSASSEIIRLSEDAANPEYGTVLTPVAENIFPAPNSTSGSRVGGWAGTSNVAPRSVVTAPWAAANSAIRTTYQTVVTNGGDMGPMLGFGPVGEPVTMAYDIYSPTTIQMNPLRLGGGGIGSSTVVATSHDAPFTLPANTPTRVWLTYIKGADWGADIRVSVSPVTRTVGLIYELSNVDAYLGEYQPGRTFFSGATANTAGSTYTWAGTVNNSASVKSDRNIIANQPTGLVLPAGITWQQVGADVAEVK